MSQISTKNYNETSVLKLIPWGPVYLYVLTLIAVWICDHISSKVWDKITYPFLNFNSINIGTWNGRYFHPTLNDRCNHSPVLGLKLVHVIKSHAWYPGCVEKNLNTFTPESCQWKISIVAFLNLLKIVIILINCLVIQLYSLMITQCKMHTL